MAISSTLASASNDSTPSCFSGARADEVYAFTTTGTQDFQATVTGATTLSLRSTCALATSERECEVSTLQGGTSTLSVSRLPAGTWFLWVESEVSPGATYTLRATLAPSPSQGESCVAGASPLSFASGRAVVSSTLVGRRDDSHASCSGYGPDAAWVFDVATPSEVTARLVTGTGMTGGVGIEGPSATGCPTQLVTGACGWAASSGGAATASAVLGPGRYHLWVDSQGGADAFTLTVELVPVAGETCAAPGELTASGVYLGAWANTTRAFDDLATSCGGAQANELVYPLTLTAPAWVQASFEGGGSLGFGVPALALKRADQCGAATDLACVAATSGGLPAVLPKQQLPAGDYFLVAEAADAAPVAGSLTAQVIPLEGSGTPGDSCASPGSLSFVNGRATVAGTTLGTPYSHAQGPCGGEGKDHVFRFVTTTTTNLRATVHADLGGGLGAPMLYLRGGSTCSTAGNVANACTIGSTLELTALPPGTWWLWVDSYYPSSPAGGYTLQVSLD